MGKTGKNAEAQRHAQAETPRSDEEIGSFQARSLVHAMAAVKAARGRCSNAEVARWCRNPRTGKPVAVVTVRRAKKLQRKPMDMSWVLRSTRLAAPYETHLCRLVAVRNGRI